MADFEPVKISKLPKTQIVREDDLIVVEKLGNDTNITRTKNVIDTFENDPSLDFSGDVTFVGEIKPPVAGNLDAVFDNLRIKQNLILNENADAYGFELSDLEDINVSDLQDGQLIVYETNTITREGDFTNVSIDDYFLGYAPNNGRTYARKNVEWTDITDCIRCPEDGIFDIGVVSINKISTGDILITAPVVFEAVLTGSPEVPEYEWSLDQSDARIVGSDGNKVIIEFDNPGQYTLRVKVTDFFSIDTPQTAAISVTVSETIGVVLIRTETDSVNTGEPVRYTASVSGNVSSPSYRWYTYPNTTSINITETATADITYVKEGNYTVTCEVSSPIASDSPQKGTYNIDARPNIGDVNVTKETFGDVSSEYPYSFSVSNTGDASDIVYLWRTNPSTSIIEGSTTRTPQITFTQSQTNYAVIATLVSARASDSPKSDTYTLRTSESFRLLQDPSNGLILTETGEYLNYTTDSYLGGAFIRRIGTGVLKPGSKITLIMENNGSIQSGLTYRWTADNQAILDSTNTKTTTATIGSTGETIFACTLSSAGAPDSPKYDTYSTLDSLPTVGHVTITTNATGGIYIDQEVQFTSTHEGTADDVTYEWFTTPSTSTIRSKYSRRAYITFNESESYVVSCVVSSSTSKDSPRSGAYYVGIEESFRLLQDPSNGLILTEAGEYLNYTGGLYLGGASIRRIGTGVLEPGSKITLIMENNGNVQSGLIYQWTADNQAILDSTNTKTITATIGSAGETIFACTLSSTIAPDSPKYDTYSTLDSLPTVGNITITTNATGDIYIDQEFQFTSTHDGTASDVTYEWFTTPSTSTIRSKYSQTAYITFNESESYTVSCVVSSSTSKDSPRSGIYYTGITETFRLLQDPSNDLILTEAGEYLNHNSP